MIYFSIEELTRSATAQKLGIDNIPSEGVKNNLETLVEKILDPLRSKFGRPILVNSGYRCPELNKAVLGARNSNHLYGYAADITTGTKDGNKILFNMIRSQFVFSELILEHGGQWVHVAYNKDRLDKEVSFT